MFSLIPTAHLGSRGPFQQVLAIRTRRSAVWMAGGWVVLQWSGELETPIPVNAPCRWSAGGRLSEGLAPVPRCRFAWNLRGRPSPARDLEPDGKRTLENTYSGHGLGFACRVGRPHFPDERRQRRGSGSSQEGPVLRREPAEHLAKPAQLDRVRHRFRHRRGCLGDCASSRRPPGAAASEEFLRIRDAGHGRRAGVRAFRIPCDLVPRP